MVIEKNIWQGISCGNIYLLDFTDIDHYHENTKQIKNETKQNKINQICHICHVNVWNTVYLISYVASYFKCVKHKQYLSLKNSKAQELRYTLN